MEAEATLDDQPLPFRQPFEPAPHRLPEKRPLCLLDGVSGSRIGKEVGELRMAVRADRLVERDRGLGAAKRLADVSERQAGRLGELRQARLAAECGRERSGGISELLLALADVRGNADRLPLV